MSRMPIYHFLGGKKERNWKKTYLSALKTKIKKGEKRIKIYIYIYMKLKPRIRGRSKKKQIDEQHRN